MPMNHYSSGIPAAVWWTQQQPLMEPAQRTPSSVTVSQPSTLWANHQFYNHHHRAAAASSMFCGQNSAFNLNLNQEEDEEVVVEPPGTDERERGESMTMQRQQQLHGDNINKDKEPMFEKPLTPSDVGKLNRLVIPKQHAEKYFPLCGGRDSAADKGLLLSFEDESGKCWRFRYSYWNSSQSYVLTKGWSRFVKEKQLDAGDVVLFERHRQYCDRLFIGSRRRPTATVGHETGVPQPAAVEAAAAAGGWTRLFYFSHPHGHGPLRPYQPDCLHAGAVVQSQTTPSGNSKRLRLFGVNLECQLESGPCNPDGSSVSSQGQAPYCHYYCTNAPPPNLQSHMDVNFSRDVRQTRYPQGLRSVDVTPKID